MDPKPQPAPARDLTSALASMAFRVEPGRFALLGFPEPPGGEDLAVLAAPPAQVLREGGETTLLVRAELLAALRARHPAARIEQDLVWIRFEAPMGWDVVGFLARVTSALAAAGVPLGAVCGFSRDHLFLAEAHLPKALQVLRSMFPELDR